MDLQRVQQIAIAAAYKGAEVLRSHFGRISRIDKKGRIDLVTEADTASEKVILDTIGRAFPDHGFLAEESGSSFGQTDEIWIIDPLDGTTNYAHQTGHYAVSIAFSRREDILVGIVLNPASGELFSAISGGGAFLNGRPIAVSTAESVSDSLLVTGFPYNLNEHLDPLIGRFAACLKAAQGVRRFGSAAIDLCHVACGRFDGFWEQHLKPWDTAAGFLIAKEAGAIVTDFSNQPFVIDKKEILATNGKIHQQMLELLELRESE